MNGKYIRTTILAALAFAGGAQAGTNAVHSLDVGEYRTKALDLIQRADVPSLQVTMTSPEGVLSFCVVNDAFYAAPVVPAWRGPHAGMTEEDVHGICQDSAARGRAG